ncbi:MAG: DUF559 domain-containing protein [Acetobacteraceae bacterium]|nr:DUF559 domain-containing protein [Acetobacteraceae bacterium]
MISLGGRFRRQHPIPPHIVDFARRHKKLIVEVDGRQHADSRNRECDAYLQRQGWSTGTRKSSL